MWCRQLLAIAEEKTNGPPDEELQQQFCELSQDLEELQTNMVRLRAEAEGIACANPRVVSTVAGADLHCLQCLCRVKLKGSCWCMLPGRRSQVMGAEPAANLRLFCVELQNPTTSSFSFLLLTASVHVYLSQDSKHVLFGFDNVSSPHLC